MIDLITIPHNARNWGQHLDLIKAMEEHEGAPGRRYQVTVVDNRIENRGFSRGCNYGAAQGSAPYIGFLNPDVIIEGPFITAVEDILGQDVVITGCRFEKPQQELKAWGCHDWVCGATFFVQRAWFESVGGFDEQFVWGWEETDLIRQAQRQRRRVQSIELPLLHASPDVDSARDARYKNLHFDKGARLFYAKWPR